MDLLGAAFWSGLLTIIVTDLVLAGDNAILIGMAARNVPEQQRKKVIVGGTVGAIVLRLIMTLLVVWLLKVPGLHLIGGILLVWIAYHLLVDDQGDDEQQSTGNNVWAAIRTIIIADALMGLDNVLAVAGAAHGDFWLVTIGLIISIPIIMGGSAIVMKWMDRFPIIIILGAAVLAWTSSKMIIEEAFLEAYFANGFVKYAFELVVVLAVVLIGGWQKKKKATQKVDKQVLAQ